MVRTSIAAALALTLVAGCGDRSDRITLTVTPASGPVDAPFRVQAAGAEPGTPLTFTVLGRSSRGRPWSLERRVTAGPDGRVDWRRAYLIAELRPEQPPAADDDLPLAQDLTITVQSGKASATKDARRIGLPASVRVDTERPGESGFYGEWFAPSGSRDHTAVLLLGGSEGGLPTVLPAVLAAHGYPVLALAYFGEPGLPQVLERIPLEYFHRALLWMRQQPEVDPKRLVTFGISRGGELSLLLAATYPDLVHGAVGYVPSSAANPGLPDRAEPAWTHRDKPVLGDIPLSRISGPVFAVGGGDDMLWPSDLYVGNVRFARRGHDRGDVTLIYPYAGHAVGRAVPSPELTTNVQSPRYGLLQLGGTPAADEAGRENSWPKLLRFLARI
jgi:dienelactone hydrolase